MGNLEGRVVSEARGVALGPMIMMGDDYLKGQGSRLSIAAIAGVVVRLIGAISIFTLFL